MAARKAEEALKNEAERATADDYSQIIDDALGYYGHTREDLDETQENNGVRYLANKQGVRLFIAIRNAKGEKTDLKILLYKVSMKKADSEEDQGEGDV